MLGQYEVENVAEFPDCTHVPDSICQKDFDTHSLGSRQTCEMLSLDYSSAGKVTTWNVEGNRCFFTPIFNKLIFLGGRRKSSCNANKKAFHMRQKGCNSERSLFLCLQFEALEELKVRRA